MGLPWGLSCFAAEYPAIDDPGVARVVRCLPCAKCSSGSRLGSPVTWPVSRAGMVENGRGPLRACSAQGAQLVHAAGAALQLGVARAWHCDWKACYCGMGRLWLVVVRPAKALVASWRILHTLGRGKATSIPGCVHNSGSGLALLCPGQNAPYSYQVYVPAVIFPAAVMQTGKTLQQLGLASRPLYPLIHPAQALASSLCTRMHAGQSKRGKTHA